MKTPIEKREEFSKWESYISDMGTFEQNPNYTYTKPKNKYYRFIDHMKGWLGEWIGVIGTEASPEDSTEMTEWRRVSSTVIGYSKDWWKAAVKGGAAARQALPTMDKIPNHEIAAELKDVIYDKFLPAYAALKESFAKRSRWEFFTNHRQYTAERDALKAMKSIITCFTRENEQMLESRYADYKNEIANADTAVNEPEQFENATARSKTEQLDGKKYFFEKTCIKLANEVQGTNLIFDSLKSVMAIFYNPAFELAKTFSTEYDNLVSAGADVATEDAMNKLMEANVQKMFESMFSATDERLLKTIHTKQSETDASKRDEKIAHEMSLADRIITAQNVVDVMLNEMTPVGFNKDKFASYAKAHMVLNNSDKIHEFLKNNLKDKYNEREVNIAIKTAQNQLKDRYFPKQPEKDNEGKVKAQDIRNIFKIGYRPDPNNASLERKNFNALQNLMNSGAIQKDETLKVVFNENVRRFKALDKLNNRKITKEEYNEQEKTWYNRDAILEVDYAKNYNPDVEAYLTKANDYIKKQADNKLNERLKKDLNKNNNKKVSPPVKNEKDINAPQKNV